MHADSDLRRVGGLFSLDGKNASNGVRDGRMERDVEIELTRAVAALDATLSGFARDVNRRFDELSRDTREIKVQVKETNGRVNAHDTKIAALEDDVKALATQADDNKPALTRREWRLVWGLLATVCGLVLTMAKLAHELWVLP